MFLYNFITCSIVNSYNLVNYIQYKHNDYIKDLSTELREQNIITTNNFIQ